MQLPPGTVDYHTIKSNLGLLRLDNFEKWMTPKVIPANDRTKVPRRRRKHVRKYPDDMELILFPSGVLASDGSFFGAVGLAAHLDRTIKAIAQEAC